MQRFPAKKRRDVNGRPSGRPASWPLDRAGRLLHDPVLPEPDAGPAPMPEPPSRSSVSLPESAGRAGDAASSSSTTSTQPWAAMRSTFRLSVDVSSCRISQICVGRASPSWGGHDQDVQLADLQPERAKGIVVQIRDDPVQHPQRHRDARPGDRIDAGLRFVHDCASPSLPP